MKVSIRPIFPKHNPFEAKKYIRAVENAGNMSAEAVRVDFLVTTKTWKHQPVFKIVHNVGKLDWLIETTDEIYGYVSLGTKPHIIVPKNARRLVFYRSGFRAKSRPGWIGSNKGAKATRDLTFAKKVHHPGTKARNFGKTIKQKWDEEWPAQLARAFRAAARAGG